MKTTKKSTPELFQITDAQKKQLQKQLEESTIWISKDHVPEIGETLIGQIVKFEDRKTQRGRKTIESSLCTIQTENGLKSFWVTAVLQARFTDNDIKVNDIIAVKYLGMVKEAKNPYHNFSVAKL